MAMSEEVKQAIVEMMDAGKTPDEIAGALGIGPKQKIGIYAVIKQERVRRGIDQHPSKARKKKVKITEEQELEADPGDVITVGKPAEPETVSDAMPSVVAGGGCPLFPRRPPTEIFSIAIERIVARPRKAGTGILGVLDHEADESLIQREFGGGRYRLIGRNALGQTVAQAVRVMDINGQSKMIEPEEEEEDDVYEVEPPKAAADDPLIKRLLEEQAETRKLLFSLTERRAEEAREAAEEERKRERDLAQERTKEQAAFFQNMMAASAANHQQMMSFILQKQSGGSSLKDRLEEIVMLREVAGGVGGEGSENAGLVALINKLPDMMQAYGDIVHGPVIGGDEEVEDAEYEETSTAIAAKAPANDNGSAPDLDEATKSYARIIAKQKGIPYAQAIKLLQFGLNYVDRAKSEASAVPKKNGRVKTKVPANDSQKGEEGQTEDAG